MNENISLKTENEEIVFADLTNREILEAVCVCKSGNIYLFDLQKGEKSLLINSDFDTTANQIDNFDLNDAFEMLRTLEPAELEKLLEKSDNEVESIESIAAKHPDLVSISLQAKLYSFENYVCIVEEKGINGFVLDLSNPNFQKNLKRGDYCVGNCSFPIAFYKKDNQTFLIHGTDWNRLDITCLETDELLTDRIFDYDTDSNYFDYFHSSLLVSPDGKNFTSNGWHWHPYGQIYCFSVEEFLQKFEISHKYIDLAENCYSFDWDRPICWIDNNTLVIGFSKNTEDYGKSSFPNEILFVEINENKILQRIEFTGFANTIEGDVFGTLFYDIENKHFISLNNKTGLLISSIDGVEIYKDSSLTSHKYSQKHKLFYQIDTQNQLIETFDFKIY
jgi:hypothetical protein